ncbi:GNAT family N-acetyltransferase [Mycobacterium numidiamassiliense]|uniref:GNAT family N-acetyltransferase n=1 Tax=Mycobacterium numidiamassiliense TaxID=1841861 RepID=UPI00097D178A|nr:GNAT family N-acetyltransferase [Mycobacterium numidiamassiliense]
MKSTDVKIRRAGPTEFAKVADMHYPVWRRSWAGMIEDYLLDVIGTPKLWAEVKYPEAVNRPGWGMWIAEARNKILGMSIYGPDFSTANTTRLEALYTADEAKSLRIGVRLLNKAVRSNPSSDVILWCAEKNEKARQFYEKHDFQLDGRTHIWKPLPGISVPHVGYRHKAAGQA